METTNTNNHQLLELSGSDYEMKDGQPDIRGWDVKDADGNKTGKVKDLLFDATSLKVRYIIAGVNEQDNDTEAEKVLIPVGIAELHEKDDDVIVPGITLEKLLSLPMYKTGELTPAMEHQVKNAFTDTEDGLPSDALLVGGSGFYNDDAFYESDFFNEENMYKNRTPGIDYGKIR